MENSILYNNVENNIKKSKKSKVAKKKIGELYSGISHGAGALLSIAGFVLMIIKVHSNKNAILPVIIYGVGIILLYTFSSLYHFLPNGKAKNIFRKFDHISIYVFIAATYTPLCVFSLPRNIGLLILTVIWTCAIIGVISNTILIYKSPILTIILYISMGWIIAFAFKPLLQEFEILKLNWLIWGGIFYTIGAFLYALQMRLPIDEVSAKYIKRPEGSHSKLNTFKDGFRILFTIIYLLITEKPLLFFNTISLIFLGIGLFLGIGITIEYFETLKVERFPTAILTICLIILSALSFSIGLLMKAISKVLSENRRFKYNSVK